MQFLNHFTVQTPESVELEFTLAGLGNRSLAAVIDYALWSLTISILLALLSRADWLTEILFDWVGNTDAIELWFSALLILISFVIYVGYYGVFETIWRGQTPGKRLAKIRVVRDDGRPIGIFQATLRSLLRPIDEFPPFYIGAFLIFFNRQEKRIGDIVAGTIVIQENRAIAPADFAVLEDSHALARKLQQTTHLSQLLPEDFAIIREFLQRRIDMKPHARQQVSAELAQQVKAALHLNDDLEDPPPEVFLEATYLAYQQQSERQ
ncbi:MAG TPA: RDD family protein [Elainellaceae cyanobacterium]